MAVAANETAPTSDPTDSAPGNGAAARPRTMDEILSSGGKRSEQRAGGRAAGRQPRPQRPSADEAPKRLTPKVQNLRDALLGIYTAAEMAAFLVDGDAQQAIANTKEACVDAWIELAQQDAKVMKMLTKLTTGSAWGGVVIAHGTMILPILAKRGIIPGGALFNGAMMNATQPQAEPEPETGFDEAAANGFVAVPVA